MAVTTESGSLLYGDWRASAYGANRRAHLFTPGRKTACGARVAYDKTSSVRKRKLADLCYECLAYGASGR